MSNLTHKAKATTSPATIIRASADLSTTIPLGDWFKNLLGKLFFQPDDALAAATYDQHIAPDLIVRVNQGQVDGAAWKAGLNKIRDTKLLTLESMEELQCWNAPDGAGGGCVSHMTQFLAKNKEDGKETKMLTPTIVNVQVRDGKRVLVEMTEVTN